MNKTLRLIGSMLFFIVGVSSFSYSLYKGFIEDGAGYLIRELAIIIPGLIIAWFFFFKVLREKAVKLSQYIGFSCFFIWMLFPSIIFSRQLSTIAIFGIVSSIMLKRDLKPKEGGRTLDEKIKNQLKINSRSRKMNLPSKIGGFVIPAFPFFHVVSRKWKGNLGKEATIHENVHLYYLQNGWLFGVVIVIALIVSQVQKFVPETFDMSLFIFFMLVVSFVFFEQVTFNKTYKIGQEMGIITRQWDWRIGLKYAWIYTLQFLAVFFIVQAFKFIFVIIKGLI